MANAPSIEYWTAVLEAHNAFGDALSAYWDAAWAEGKENRSGDTANAAALHALAAIYTTVGNMISAELAARGAKPTPAEISDSEIDRLAELTVKAMPSGIRGFMTVWGWQQFARTLIENLEPYGLRCAAASEAPRHD